MTKIYTFFFIAFVVFSFWLQKHTIEIYSKEWFAYKNGPSVDLPTLSAQFFNFTHIENDKAKDALEGKSIKYFKNNTFKTYGDVVYTNFSSPVIKGTSTDIEGEFEAKRASQLFPNTFKFLYAPKTLYLFYNDYYGVFKTVTLQFPDKTLNTDAPFRFDGPRMYLQGTGFKWRKNDFLISHHVKGRINLKK